MLSDWQIWRSFMPIRAVEISNFFFQAEDGIRDSVASRGLGDVYKRQKKLLPWNFDLFLILRFFYSEDGRIQRSFLDLGTF